MKCCNQCILTEADYPNIILDTNGICDICLINEKKIEEVEVLKKGNALQKLLSEIKKNKKGKYDCLIGVSGGTDSSYMVHLAKSWGLNPLLFHVDGGWNSEKAVINVERIVDRSGFDFVTKVLPWHEMRDLQQAFIKANVIDIDLPFDNALMAEIFNLATQYKIKYILYGYNNLTEGIMPSNFTHYKFDKRNIYDIHKTFGEIPLKHLRILGTFDFFYYTRYKKLQFVFPLNYIDYNKEEAKRIIEKNYDWVDYGGKHYESVFTRFYQGYILPKKFNVDKRKSHLSMLICSKQLTKKEALIELNSQEPYPNKILERDDLRFFQKKLKLTEEEFKLYMLSPGVSHRTYKSDLDYYDLLRPAYRFLKKTLGLNWFR
jgi:N-acetyl sugar amidotransferase